MSALPIFLPRKAKASACYAMGIWIARQATKGPLLLSAEQATRVAELLLSAGQYGVAGCRPPKAKGARGRKGAC